MRCNDHRRGAGRLARGEAARISPACDINFSLYKRFPTPDGSIAVSYEPIKVGNARGIDVEEEPGFHRLEIYTGNVTIKVFKIWCRAMRSPVTVMIGASHGWGLIQMAWQDIRFTAA